MWAAGTAAGAVCDGPAAAVCGVAGAGGSGSRSGEDYCVYRDICGVGVSGRYTPPPTNVPAYTMSSYSISQGMPVTSSKCVKTMSFGWDLLIQQRDIWICRSCSYNIQHV